MGHVKWVTCVAAIGVQLALVQRISKERYKDRQTAINKKPLYYWIVFHEHTDVKASLLSKRIRNGVHNC